MTLLLLLACAPKEAPPETTAAPRPEPPEVQQTALVTTGSLEERVSRWPADLAVFYGGEHKGSIETCGCPKRPRGSLARQLAYTQASTDANPSTPTLVLHGGYWLEDSMGVDGELRPDVPVMNRWMLRGIEATGFDAINVTFQDLPGFQELEEAPGWAVSANVAATDGRPAPAPYRILDKDGLRVGVTGITREDITFVPTPDYRVGDPVEAAVAALQEMADQVDLLVLLAFRTAEEARLVAEQVPELDLVIDTAMHRELYDPILVGQTLWLRSHYQTMRLGELRLTSSDGAITAFVDRKIDLDPEVPDEAGLAAISREARGELEKIQAELFGVQ